MKVLPIEASVYAGAGLKRLTNEAPAYLTMLHHQPTPPGTAIAHTQRICNFS